MWGGVGRGEGPTSKGKGREGIGGKGRGKGRKGGGGRVEGGSVVLLGGIDAPANCCSLQCSE